MFFARLYQRVMQWARSRYAVHILALISFIESIFFPIPPDVMLAPMAMAKPDRALYYAMITTVFSVLGGIVGYGIGVLAFPTLVEPFLQHMGYMDKYEMIHQWFVTWGFWVVFIAGFSPIPYKLFTVTAGLTGVGFLPFLIASITSRGLRFVLVSVLMAKGGPKLEKFIHDMLVRFGWAMVAVFGLALGAVYFLK
jgi:membrane protein YqaA with SNARE-associated domain